MSRRPCAHCQRLWSTKTLVTVGAAELCPVCYKQRRWTRKLWPCRDCTFETDRTLVCHDECQQYAMTVPSFGRASPVRTTGRQQR